MSVRDSWILIGLSIAAIWTLWGVLHIVFYCIEYWQAARRGEDSSTNKERGSSLL